jgi:hypothetical protein
MRPSSEFLFLPHYGQQLAVNFYVVFQFSESARSFVDDFSKTQQTGKDILTKTTFYHQKLVKKQPK